jgi:hypothetical protein
MTFDNFHGSLRIRENIDFEKVSTADLIRQLHVIEGNGSVGLRSQFTRHLTSFDIDCIGQRVDLVISRVKSILTRWGHEAISLKEAQILHFDFQLFREFKSEIAILLEGNVRSQEDGDAVVQTYPTCILVIFVSIQPDLSSLKFLEYLHRRQ